MSQPLSRHFSGGLVVCKHAGALEYALLAMTAAEPVQSATEHYRGRPDGLALSKDGRVVVISYTGPQGAGVAVFDGGDGRLRAIHDYSGQSIDRLVVSSDGARLLTLCCDVDESLPLPTELARLAQIDLADGTQTVLREGHISEVARYVWALGFDPATLDRALVLAADRPLYATQGAPLPDNPIFLFALAEPAGSDPEPLAAWSIKEGLRDNLTRISPISIVSGGSIILIGWSTHRHGQVPVEVFLEPGREDPIIRSIPQLRDVGRPLAVSEQGRWVLAARTWDRGHYQQYQDLVLLDRDGRSGAERRLTQLECAVRHAAISADGRHAALIAEPLAGPDPQLGLHLVDIDDGQIRTVDLAATAGLGRTIHRARVTSQELLGRLKLIMDEGMVADRNAVERILELRFSAGERDTVDYACLTGAGDLSPDGQSATYTITRQLEPINQIYVSLRLTLVAGPSLTPPDIIAVFGPVETDGTDMSVPPPPYSQPQRYFDYLAANGASVSFTMRYQHCAEEVTLAQCLRR